MMPLEKTLFSVNWAQALCLGTSLYVSIRPCPLATHPNVTSAPLPLLCAPLPSVPPPPPDRRCSRPGKFRAQRVRTQEQSACWWGEGADWRRRLPAAPPPLPGPAGKHTNWLARGEGAWLPYCCHLVTEYRGHPQAPLTSAEVSRGFPAGCSARFRSYRTQTRNEGPSIN